MESVFCIKWIFVFMWRGRMDIGEMDLMDVWNHPSDILLFMNEKLFISEKKDVIARHGITLGCCGIYVHLHCHSHGKFNIFVKIKDYRFFRFRFIYIEQEHIHVRIQWIVYVAENAQIQHTSQLNSSFHTIYSLHLK